MQNLAEYSEMIEGEMGQEPLDWEFLSLAQYTTEVRDFLQNLSTSSNESTMIVVALIEKFQLVARAYYERARIILKAEGRGSNYMRRLQSVIGKLTDEWLNIIKLVRLLPIQQDQAAEPLARMIKGVMDDLKIGDRELVVEGQSAHYHARHPILVPTYGRRFEVVRLNYAPENFILGVPISNLYAPWTWSIIWHELANLVLNDTRVKTFVTDLVTKVTLVRNPPAGSDLKDQRNAWYDKNEKRRQSEQELQTGELALKIERVDDENSRVYSVGWIEELIEDSCSILALGLTGYQILYNVLEQNYDRWDVSTDARHPIPALRLEVALGLLNRMGMDTASLTPQHKTATVMLDSDDKDYSGRIADAIIANQALLVSAELSPLAKAARQVVTDANKQFGMLVKSVGLGIPVAQEEPPHIAMGIASGAAETATRQQIWDHMIALLEQSSPHVSNIDSSSVKQIAAAMRVATSDSGLFDAELAKIRALPNWDAIAKYKLSETDEVVGVDTFQFPHAHTDGVNIFAAFFNLGISGREHGGIAHFQSFSWTHGPH